MDKLTSILSELFETVAESFADILVEVHEKILKTLHLVVDVQDQVICLMDTVFWNLTEQ